MRLNFLHDQESDGLQMRKYVMTVSQYIFDVISWRHRLYEKIANIISETLAKISNHVTTAHETATLAYGSSLIDKINGSLWQFHPAQGAYFQILDYSKISSLSDIDFAKLLVEKHKIATIPVSVFYPRGSDDKLLRICFAKEEKTLEKAAEILLNIANP